MFSFTPTPHATPIYWIDETYWSSVAFARSPALTLAQKTFLKAQEFTAKEGQLSFIPDDLGNITAVIFGGGVQNLSLLETLPPRLPKGEYTLFINEEKPENISNIAYIWAEGHYQFDRYKKVKPIEATLVLGPEHAHLEQETQTLHLLRDWVNTPAEDMHPESFSDLIQHSATQFGAEFEAVIGEDLLAQNYPMIHAVGRAGHYAPRYCTLSWNADKTDLPLVALVGKGVCFDTGGLNIKTGNYMRVMKKDMGGAAHALGLARLIMAADLPVRLHLGVPLVENNIAANAFKPGDIIPTRKGLNVEIDNTDAEGRLVLADGLARACELSPDVLLDFATLTGAARVAIGPDLAPIFTDDTILADAILSHGEITGDPLWPLPLWKPYRRYLNSPIADIQNSGGRFAGAITAALFLKEFVSVSTPQWAHFDVWAWREARNGKPEGAYPCAIRAVWSYLQDTYSNPLNR